MADLEDLLPGVSSLAGDTPLLLRLHPGQKPFLYFSGQAVVLDFNELDVGLYMDFDSAWVRLVGGLVHVKANLAVYQADSGPATIVELDPVVPQIPLFGEILGDSVGQDSLMAALDRVAENLVARRLDPVLPTVLSGGVQMVYKSFEVRGGDEPYLYLYFDLERR